MSEIFHIVPDVFRGGRAKRFASNHGGEVKESKLLDLFSALNPGVAVGGSTGFFLPGIIDGISRNESVPISGSHWILTGIVGLAGGVLISAEHNRRVGRQERIYREEIDTFVRQRRDPRAEQLRNEVFASLAGNRKAT